MNTPENTRCMLDQPHVAALVARLFADAEETQARVGQIFGSMPPEERARRMSDPDADYRDVYHRARELHLAVAPATARLLYMLTRSTGARAIVEFGTSFGISTIAPRRGAARQRRRPAGGERARAGQGRAGDGQPRGGRPRRHG